MTDLEANKAIAVAYLKAISSGDTDALADMFTEDGVIIVESNTKLPPEIRGREPIREFMRGIPLLFPDTGLAIHPDEMTAEGDRVAVVAHSDAVHVSGKPYRNRYHFLIRIRDGKIVASHEYLDSLHLSDVFFGD
jgi:uncharacterized protein (TIGR02246 family)